MDTLHLNSDDVIRLKGPTNAQTGATLEAATCNARLFALAKDDELAADEASGQTVLSVRRATQYELGDVLELRLDDATRHNCGAITAIDLTNKTVTVTNALASGASQGQRLARKLGATISMATYGTPVAWVNTWGFAGTKEDTHADLLEEMRVRVEIELNGGAGLQYVENRLAIVKRG